MKISSIEKSYDANQVKLSSKVETKKGTFSLWFATDKKYDEFMVHERLDAFLLGLLIHAMELQEDIYLDAPVSEKLFYGIRNDLMKIYSLVSPVYKKIKIYPKELSNTALNPDQGNIVTGFSGGIDSFSVLYDHYYSQDVPENYRITHLIYNNVGAHGEKASVFFHKRYEFLKKFSEEEDLPFIKIDSNLYDILESSFMDSVIIRNVASVMILQKLFSKYIYASGYSYRGFLQDNVYDIGYVDPIAFPFMATEKMEPVLTGSYLSRVEKTKQVSELEPTYNHLYVCTNTKLEDVKNCSECFKCARTLLTLEILGKKRLYKNIFNLEKFEEIKKGYIETLLYENDPYAKEIIQLAKENDYKIPMISRIMASKFIYPIAKFIRLKFSYRFRQKLKAILGLNKLR